MNRYKITFTGYTLPTEILADDFYIFTGYTLPTEILADDFYIEPDTGNAIFHNNGCDMRKVATFKEYSNIILVQEDEVKNKLEKNKLIIDDLTEIHNKQLKMYKYGLLICTLTIILIFAYFINI